MIRVTETLNKKLIKISDPECVGCVLMTKKEAMEVLDQLKAILEEEE